MKKIEVDTVVIGAGLVGSSVAMHLSSLGVEGIQVLDFDLEGSLSSSELNAGGVRATWVQPVNIQTSKLSIEYYDKMKEDVGYRPVGYLWLQPPEKMEKALQAYETQLELGWEVEKWNPEELTKKRPFINKTERIAGAFFAPRDGLVNPNLLKLHYREEAKKRKVDFTDRTLVESARFDGNEVELIARQYPQVITETVKSEILSGAIVGSENEGEPIVYRAKRVVNCAGAWASEVAEMLGYECPSYPVRRQVSIFDARGFDMSPYGMVIDPNGVYFHPEAQHVLAGYANPDEPKGINFNYDGDTFFTEVIWPFLYECSTRFEELKHITGWAGMYETSPDHSAIIGKVTQGEAGSFGGIYEAHSFSGHGAMQSYAAGLALAEKIHFGKYETLDLESLSAERFSKNQLINESLVI